MYKSHVTPSAMYRGIKRPARTSRLMIETYIFVAYAICRPSTLYEHNVIIIIIIIII